ncbi:MAG: hypothetical protein QGG36_20970 [Pirellulaceae bacterium]|nr:hypothetical protein [Pirellulaceae bacterium]MDP7018291.1 hypothetical protein [Pirellulaceae bacterium]
MKSMQLLFARVDLIRPPVAVGAAALVRPLKPIGVNKCARWTGQVVRFR